MSAATTSPDTRPATLAELEYAAWTADALCSVWERQHERVSERISVVEQALAALGEDCLDAELRGDAERAAHMLAGSVGMFGFLDASDAAHELESELRQATADHASELLALLERLREGIQGPVTLRTDEVTEPHARGEAAQHLGL
jgi:HPt (histidine-containing phosphotransfer) domain-containing protein